MAEEGWQEDPAGRYRLRWHDGTAWTDQVSDDSGATLTDPAGAPDPQPVAAPPTAAWPSEPTKARLGKAWWLLGLAAAFVALLFIGIATSSPSTDTKAASSPTTTTKRATTTTKRATTTTKRATTTTKRAAATPAFLSSAMSVLSSMRSSATISSTAISWVTPTTTTTKAPVDPVVAQYERDRRYEKAALKRLRKKLSDALGSSNRDIKPRYTVAYAKGNNVVVTWAINDNLTEGLTKDGARLDAVHILKAIRDAKVGDYEGAALDGTFSLVDQLGNVSEDRVVLARYSKQTINSIKFKNFDLKNVFDPGVADSAQIHPSFQY